MGVDYTGMFTNRRVWLLLLLISFIFFNLHDPEVQIWLLSILVQLLLEWSIKVHPANLGIGSSGDISEPEEVGLLETEPLTHIVHAVSA